MATINQSPTGQTSRALSSINLPGLSTSVSSPSRKGKRFVTVSSEELTIGGSSGGGFSIPSSLLLGATAETSATQAQGVFLLTGQLAAKRVGAWP